MRRLFLSILASAVCVSMQATEVNQQKAQETAKAFMTKIMATDNSRQGTRTREDMISLKTVETGLKGLHVFNLDGGNGFVIVSGSDQTEAVLGYATSGSIDGEMPPAMRALLQSYASQITRAEQGAGKVEGETTGISLTKQEVAPLITSKWGQDAPYNNMTPTIVSADNKTIHCPTGCVATAAAMVMRYHEWPKQQTAVIPKSMHLPELPATTFDWAAMTDTYNDKSSKEACDAVATLMRYCGGAFKMEYGGTTSSSNTDFAAYGLLRFFGYDKDICVTRRTLVTEWEWQEMIYEELAENRPVIAGGDGHEIIIDGYRQGDFFHINWGWNGGTDGYFQLSAHTHFKSTSPVLPHFPYEIITGIKPAKEPFTYQETLTTSGLIVSTDTPLQLERTGNSNFPTIKTILCLRNICRDMEDKTFDIGIALYSEEKQVKVFEVASNKKFHSGSLLDNVEVELTFGEGLDDGQYQLHAVSRLQGTKEWLKNQNVEPYYIDANVAGNTLSLATYPRDHRLKINSIKFSGDLTEGGKVTAVANITNGSKYDYDGVTILVYDTSDGKKQDSQTLCETFQPIAAGKTEDVTFNFTVGEAKTYQTYIQYEAFMLGEGVPMVIKSYGSEEENVGDYVQLEKTMTMKNSKITGKDNYGNDIYDLSGREFDITVTLKNTDAKVTYKGDVSTFIYRINPETNISELITKLTSKNVTIAPGQSTDVRFYYDKMKPNNEYYLNLQASYFGNLDGDEKILCPTIMTVVGINIFKADRSVESQLPSATLTVPADAIAVELSGCGVTTLTPNDQPNCLYYLNDTDAKPATLEGHNVVIESANGSTAETLTLKDGYGFMAPEAFVANNVTYTRTFIEAEYHGYTTLVLPFDVQRQEAGGEAFTIHLQELCGDQPGKVYVGGKDELPVAAKPYLIRLKADATLKNPVTFSAKDAIISDSTAIMTAGLYNFQGSFSKRQLSGEECFSFADGKSDTVVPKADVCPPFRAYFQPIGMPTHFEALAIDDQTLNPTGIKEVKAKTDESRGENTYNLSGQRVSGAYKGIVIKNGIKVVK